MKTGTKLALLSSLYFSQGLPFGFFTQALPVLMRERGLDLASIGLTNLLALPWALKFLWAPGVDRARRKRVIVPLQLATVALLVGFERIGWMGTFLVDLGLTIGDVGRVLGIVGFVAGMSGALFGGWLAQRIGRRNALIASGILQSLAALLYVVPAICEDTSWLWGIAAFEHFTGGMATAALFTAMMDVCRKDRAATDYTVQACAVVIATGLAQSASGFLAGNAGYAAHFAIAAALSLAGVLFVVRYPARDDRFALAGAPGALGGKT